MRYMFLWKSLVSPFGVFEFVLMTIKLDCTKYFDNVGCLLKISLLTLRNYIMAEKLRHFWRYFKEKMKWRQAAPPNGLILGGRIGCAASSRRLQYVRKKMSSISQLLQRWGLQNATPPGAAQTSLQPNWLIFIWAAEDFLGCHFRPRRTSNPNCHFDEPLMSFGSRKEKAKVPHSI